MKAKGVKQIQRRFFVVAAILLSLALIATAIWLLDRLEDKRLDDLQKEAYEELLSRRGDYDMRKIVLQNTTPGAARAMADRFNAKLRITGNGQFATLTLPEGVSILDIYAAEENRTYIADMAPDYYAHTADLGSTMPLSQPNYTISDPGYTMQDYLEQLNIGHAWERGFGTGITVAVIDSGIDTDHPEFAGRISEYSYNASSDSIVKDHLLEDGSYDWSLIEDEVGHGTGVAGVIAAAIDGQGTVGIAPEVTVLVIKANCSPNGQFLNSSDLVFGLYYAIERDVDIVNMSFGIMGQNPFSAPLKLAVDSDVLCVAAAGNDGTSALSYPAADSNVIGVGALAEGSFELADYSNYGENIDIVAPGTAYTTTLNGQYRTEVGTSVSCPMVTGGLALYLARNRYQTFWDIYEHVAAASRDLGDLGPDWYFGYGAFDINAMVYEERGKVTFHMLTDELGNIEQVFVRNHTLQNLPEPERIYSVFDGWYHDIDCTEPLRYYEDIFTSDLTLYAAWTNEEDGLPYTYATLDDGSIEICSYTGKRRYITLPDYIDGKPVTSIAAGAFAYQSRLREVTLPSTLKRIGDQAFLGCNNLVLMKIPDGVQSIGAGAFTDNIRLSAVVFGANSQLLTIGRGAFQNCANISRFELPQTVKTIASDAFIGMTDNQQFSILGGKSEYFSILDGVLFNATQTKLIAFPAGKAIDSYEIPDSVREIGAHAFQNARLKSILLNRVSSVGSYAFHATRLTALTIPDSVTSLGEGAFSSNGALATLSIGHGLASLPTSAFSGSTLLSSVHIPANITYIGQMAFYECYTLSSVTFAEGSKLTAIGSSAFEACDLREITIPKSVRTLESSCFSVNPLVRVLFAPGSALQTIGDMAFVNCTLLQEIELPLGVQSIGAKAFMGTQDLRQITLPGQLQVLGPSAFENSGLRTIELPASLQQIGAGAFAACLDLEKIDVLGKNHFTAKDGVLYTADATTLMAYPCGKADTTFTVPQGTGSIFGSAFYGALKLERVVLPEGLLTVGSYAFAECRNITSYDLGPTLKQIDQYAFAYNTALTTMNLPESLTEIGECAFAYSYRLSRINLPDTSKMTRISFGAFGYTGIYSFRVPANISSIAQYAFVGSYDLSRITFAKNSKLESITAYMFLGCESLSRVTFESGSSLTNIQAHAFDGLSALREINFGDAKITNLDNYAFRYCERLSTITLPQGLKTIGRYAFYGCKGLSKLYIPESVEFIGENAFYYADNLNLYFAAESLPPYLADRWDNGIRGYYVGVESVVQSGDWSYAKLKSGKISLIQYHGSDTHLDLTNLSIGTVATIGGEAFRGCAIESIILPDTLTEIHRYAFADTALKRIDLPNSLTVVAQYAFANSKIEAVQFGIALTKIEPYAFTSCRSLKTVKLPATLTSLGAFAFAQSGLTQVDLTEYQPTSLPEGVFMGTDLVAVDLPDNLTYIDHNAFRDCVFLKKVRFGQAELQLMSNVFYNTGLDELYIPDNLTYIGEYSLVGLRDLKAFTVSPTHPKYQSIDGLLFSRDGRKLIAAPGGMTGELTLPASLEVLGFGAFENSRLEKINFHPDSNILTFGYRCFYNAAIKELTVPQTVVNFDFYAFAMCRELTAVRFAEGSQLKGIYEGAFYNCTKLQDIVLPDSIVEISDYAFYGCVGLKKLPISETSTLRGIYSYAFAYTAFEELTLPDTLYDIGNYAFYGAKLKSLCIPSQNPDDLLIGLGILQNCQQIETLSLPFIGAYTGDTQNTWLGYLFGAGGYGGNNLYTPASLHTVILQEGATTIGRYAFYQLEHLQSLVLPNSLTAICEDSFTGTKVRYQLPVPVTYYRWRYPNNFVVSEWIGSSMVGDGVFGHYPIGEGIVGIEKDTFHNCKELTGVTLPDSLTTINDDAFVNCGLLTSITLPKNLTHIGQGAFGNCFRLKKVINNSALPIILDGSDYGWVAIRAQIVIGPDGSIQYKDGKEFAYLDTADGFRFQVLEGVYTLIDYFGEEETAFFPEKVNGQSYYIENITGVKNAVLPDGLEQISIFAFKNCTTLQSISIPASVKTIGAYAFAGCTNLRSVTIPEGVTELGYNAFQGCTSLSSVVLPASLTELKADVFSGCTSLMNVKLPEGLQSIGSGAFTGCTGLTSLTLPQSLNSISSTAFLQSGLTRLSLDAAHPYLCFENGILYNREKTKIHCLMDSVTELDVPNTLQSLSVSGNTNLTAVRFAADSPITTIGYYAFSGCTKLTSVVLPDGLTSIRGSAFKGCESLTSLVLPKGVRLIEDNTFAGCKSLRQLTLPEGLTSIGVSAFEDCKSLEQLNLSEGLTYINRRAFAGSGLTTCTLPNSATELGDYLFEGCRNLTRVTLPNTLWRLPSYCFSSSGLTEVIIPDSVQYISYGAFSGTKLKSITLPDSVESMGEGVFYMCQQLEQVHLSSALTEIPERTFSTCYLLKQVDIPDGIVSIEREAFLGCQALSSISLPKTVTTIHPDAFRASLLASFTVHPDNPAFSTQNGLLYNREKTELVFVPIGIRGTVTLPGSLIHVPERVFAGRDQLTAVILSEGIETIGQSCFHSCTALKTVTMPSSLTAIGASAFEECESLQAVINLPNSVREIGAQAFLRCYNLSNITLPSSLTTISHSVFEYCWMLDSVVIPEGVTTIGEDAFNRSGLFTVTIPKNVTSIGADAFAWCSSLYEVVNQSALPFAFNSSSHGNITQHARVIVSANGSKQYKDGKTFYYVDTPDGLRFSYWDGEYTLVAYRGNQDTVTLPRRINGKAYRIYHLDGIKHVIFPSGWTEISWDAFLNSQVLESVVIPEGVCVIGTGAFAQCPNLTSVTLPNSLREIDYYAFARSGLVTLHIPSSVTVIGDYAFEECTSLTSVTLPNITEIGRQMFGGCTSLKEITIPSSVQVIRDHAFYGSGLVTLHIPYGVTEIQNSAFEYCRELTNISLPDSLSVIGSNVFKSVPYCSDPANWDGDALYIGRHLIRVGAELTEFVARPDTGAIAQDAFADSKYTLRTLTIGGDQPDVLKGMTNLETLILYELPKNYNLLSYFNRYSYNATVPITFKTVVLRQGCMLRSSWLFSNLTGLTIYVEELSRNLNWDRDYENWHGGNRAYYGDQWITATFKDLDGSVITNEYYLTSQVIRQPFMESGANEDGLLFVGWDINGDGLSDLVPATSATDISARAVYSTHRPGMWEEKAPDCMTAGYRRLHCLDCDQIIEEIFYPAHGHISSERLDTVAPTCTEEGYTLHTCAICGSAFRVDPVPATGHSFGDPLTETTASCQKTGLRYCICTVCGVRQDEVLPLIGHHYTQQAQQAATCAKMGQTTYACLTCQQTLQEETAKSAHNYAQKKISEELLSLLTAFDSNIAWSMDEGAPFCLICTDCQSIMTTAEAPTTACTHTHSYTPLAPCTLDGGAEAVTCTLCNTVLDIHLGGRSLPHNEVPHEAKEPSCTEIGWDAYVTCRDCPYSTYAERQALGHTGGQATCLAQAICMRCNQPYGDLGAHTPDETGRCTLCTQPEPNPSPDSDTDTGPSSGTDVTVGGGTPPMMVIIAAAAVILIGLGGAATWFFLRKKKH